MTLTRDFLLARGSCCGLKCKNCPYTKPHKKGNTDVEPVVSNVCMQDRDDRLEARTKKEKS